MSPTSSYLSKPLRSLQQAIAENRQEALDRLRHVLDRAEDVANAASYDMPNARELNLMGEVENKIREAIEALDLITGRERPMTCQEEDDAAEAAGPSEAQQDLAWHQRRVL